MSNRALYRNPYDDELILRYGPDVLSIRRAHVVPPRVASPGKLLTVVSLPAAREKLRTEIRRAGARIYGDRHRVTNEPTPGNYTFTNFLPAFTKHAARVLGEAARRDVLPLYGRREAKVIVKPYEVGDAMRVTAGSIEGKLVKLIERKSKASWLVDCDGKRFVLHITNMVRIDPG